MFCNFTYYLVNRGIAGFSQNILLKASTGTNVRMVEAFGNLPVCQSVQHFSQEQDSYIHAQWIMNPDVYGNPLVLLKCHHEANNFTWTQEIPQSRGKIAFALIGNSPKDEHFPYWILQEIFVKHHQWVYGQLYT